MARFYGKIGYGVSEEAVAGVWSDVITERAYYGDVLSDLRSNAAAEKVNDDVRLQNRISIVADAYALGNYIQIKYVEWAGFLWTVNSVDVERPRLILSLGGVYNGPRPEVVVP
jgi:fructose-1,6-bisphosphatase/inositol monophosphatase family enzyme